MLQEKFPHDTFGIKTFSTLITIRVAHLLKVYCQDLPDLPVDNEWLCFLMK